MHPLLRAGAAIALGASAAVAQPTDPPIPAELVRAVMTPQFGSSPATFIIGKLPPTWPTELVPPSARTLGVVDNQFQGRTAVFQVAETPELIIPDFAASLRKRGWVAPPPRVMPGGFGMGGMQAPQMSYCRSDTLTVITGSPRLTGGYVYVAMRTGPRAVECRAPVAGPRSIGVVSGGVSVTEMRAAAPRPPESIPVPTLQTPDGVQSLRSSSSGEYDRWSGQSQLRTGLRPAELLDLYGVQLAKAGWTLGERLAGTTVAMQIADRRDSTGAAWRATLTASALGDSLQREMALRIVDKSRP